MNAARQLLDHPVVTEILNDMEAAAITVAINSATSDPDTAVKWLLELRSIRNFRAKLRLLCSEAEHQIKRDSAAE